MEYYSLNKISPTVDFRTATIQGQAPDKGLYFPERIPRLDQAFFRHIENMSNQDIAFQVISPFVGKCLHKAKLQSIIEATLSFPIPLVQITDSVSTLELFHGPTLAFKDIGARFMSRCLGEFLKDTDRKVTVLVATSGDTGGAVASGFYGIEGIEVVILYPSGKVSEVQEKQMTSLGKNISALEVKGNFDDCQRLVKEAFTDAALQQKVFLTSANSINVARWLPQQIYYFLAYKQWPYKPDPPVISVPSGNFGNICAGIMAFLSGLPTKHFMAACNANDTIPRYLVTSVYKPKETLATLSSAMDVSDPSNFIRILEAFGRKSMKLGDLVSATSVSDAETLHTIKIVQERFDYTLDPHGAVGYHALDQYLKAHHGLKGYFLETAHPIKFPDAIHKATGQFVPIPEGLRPLMVAKKKSLVMENDYEALRAFLYSK